MTTYFAHRGLSSLAPENTLAAFRLAAEHGFTWFETDIDLSKDGVPVLLHDLELDRTTNMSGSLYDFSAAELEAADAGAWFGADFAGEKLPTLADLVDLMNELKLNGNIELKSNLQGAERSFALVDAVIAELARLDADREVIISSFSPLLLAEFKRRAPHLKVALLVELVPEDWRSQLELIGAEAIHPDGALLTRAQVAELREAGYGVHAWTVNSRARANQLANWGVTGIITDEPINS